MLAWAFDSHTCLSSTFLALKLTSKMTTVRELPSIHSQIEGHIQRKRTDSAAVMAERSEENAKEAMQEFSKQEQNPVAENGAPKSKPGITFAHQDKLPKLPIPDLDATCNRYLLGLEPLQTSREHTETENAVQEFLRTDGPILQEKLKSYSQDQTSYIEQFCKLRKSYEFIRNCI